MAFLAQFPGRCADCESRISPGDNVTYDLHDALVHVNCPDPITGEYVDNVSMGKGIACATCFCYHAGECA